MDMRTAHMQSPRFRKPGRATGVRLVNTYANGTFDHRAAPAMFDERPELKAYVMLWGTPEGEMVDWYHPAPGENVDRVRMQRTHEVVRRGCYFLIRQEQLGRGIFYTPFDTPPADDPVAKWAPWLALTDIASTTKMTMEERVEFLDKIMYDGWPYGRDGVSVTKLTEELVPGNVMVQLPWNIYRPEVELLKPHSLLYPYMIRTLYSRYHHPTWALARYSGARRLTEDDILAFREELMLGLPTQKQLETMVEKLQSEARAVGDSSS